LICSSSLRGSNSETTHYPVIFFFQLNTLKIMTKAPTLELLRLYTLRGTKNVFLIPKWYDEHPYPFYTEVPLPGENSPI